MDAIGYDTSVSLPRLQWLYAEFPTWDCASNPGGAGVPEPDNWLLGLIKDVPAFPPGCCKHNFITKKTADDTEVSVRQSSAFLGLSLSNSVQSCWTRLKSRGAPNNNDRVWQLSMTWILINYSIYWVNPENVWKNEFKAYALISTRCLSFKCSPWRILGALQESPPSRQKLRCWLEVSMSVFQFGWSLHHGILRLFLDFPCPLCL